MELISSAVMEQRDGCRDARPPTRSGPVFRSLASLLTVAVLVLAGVSGGACTSADTWTERLGDTIDPVNQLVHKDLKVAYLERDLERVLSLYDLPDAVGTEGSRAHRIERERRELLGRFDHVARAIVSLRVPAAFDVPQPGYVTLPVRSFLIGDSPTGPLQVVEDATMVVRHTDPLRPRIVEHTVDALRVIARPPGARFTDVAREAGVTLIPANVGRELRSAVIPDRAYWSGACCGDYDADGDDDLYLVSGTADRLYRNDGDGTFTDMTSEAGLGGNDSIGHGALFGDLDNDGYPDLIVVNLLDPNRVYRNLGDGTFEEMTAIADLPRSPYNTSSAMLDFDNDGDLDVFILGGGNFVDGTPQPVYEAVNGTPNLLLRNDGGFRFTDVAEAAGVAGTDWGLAVSCTDFDLDGDQDIYVANDFGLNALYRNEADGTFVNVAEEAGVTLRGPGMGCTWGDYDNDGLMDLFVSNMFSNSEWMLHHAEYPLPASPIEVALFRPFIIEILHEMTRGSALLRNRGDGTFEDVSDRYEMRDEPKWAWGCAFLDMDNDADQDLLVVNGMISGERTYDF